MQANIYHQIESIASKSKTDNIFIIGKGPSLDEIDFSTLQGGLVVNINDSERVISGDIGVFSANWVRHSLQEDGFRCSFYLAGKPLPDYVEHAVLPPLPIELDQEEMMILRLERDEFYDESFVLLNALKLALQIQKIRQRPQNVYLLGFDFSVASGAISRKAGVDFSGATLGERDAIISSQEHALRQILHYFGLNGRINVLHVGAKDFSALSTVAFNQKFSGVTQPPPVHPIDLSNPDRVLIVAELTNNHWGDKDRLVEMVERAKQAGADLIKVQKRNVDTFYTPEQLSSYYWSPFGNTLGDYRRGVELDDEKLDLLDEVCRQCEIEWFCSVLDIESFHAIKRFNPRLIKVPSTISNHHDFHAALVEQYKGAVVVSTGLTDATYIDYVLKTFGQNELIYLLHCISAYPTPKEACNVAVVRAYHDLSVQNPQIIPGYSSHDLGSLGCMLAVASGARMLEKHVKLGDAEWVHFDKVALDLGTSAFAEFVREVRNAELLVGSSEKRILECEHHKYPVK